MDEKNLNEQEIDLFELVKILFTKWYMILASTLIVTIAAAAYAFFMLDDVYTAEASMLVQVESDTQSESVNFQLGQRLVDTYTEVANSNLVLNELKANLNLDYTNTQLRNMIIVSGVADTIVIRLSVESGDPAEASAIANELLMIIEDLSASDDFKSLENIDVLDQADTPLNPSGPNRLLYIAIGFILGGILGVGIIFVIEFLDKTVKSSNDIEYKLGLKTLGIIPDYAMEDEVDEE